MRLIPITFAFLIPVTLCWVANGDDAVESDVIQKLATMKPSIALESVERPNTASVLLYTVEGQLLGGKPAAICDINNCRIAIVGVDISKTRSRNKSLNLRVAGEKAEAQTVKGTDGKPFFFSKYESSKQSKKAQCRFYNFEFDMTDRHLGFGPRKPAGYRSSGTLWANPSNAGVLILVDSSTGKFTTHAMRPKSKRVELPESKSRE